MLIGFSLDSRFVIKQLEVDDFKRLRRNIDALAKVTEEVEVDQDGKKKLRKSTIGKIFGWLEAVRADGRVVRFAIMENVVLKTLEMPEQVKKSIMAQTSKRASSNEEEDRYEDVKVSVSNPKDLKGWYPLHKKYLFPPFVAASAPKDDVDMKKDFPPVDIVWPASPTAGGSLIREKLLSDVESMYELGLWDYSLIVTFWTVTTISGRQQHYLRSLGFVDLFGHELTDLQYWSNVSLFFWMGGYVKVYAKTCAVGVLEELGLDAKSMGQTPPDRESERRKKWEKTQKSFVGWY